MAPQDISQPQTTVVVAPPAPQLAHSHVIHNCSSASPASTNASFVKSLDRKARSYLKMLECSLSFSAASSKSEDSSAMTIEFLRVRLQAQRAEYKAEKQRAQHLAKKVMELERRLKLEVEHGKSAAPTSLIDNPCDGSRCEQCRRYIGERIIDRKNTDLQLVKRGMPRQGPACELTPYPQPLARRYKHGIHDPSASTSATSWHNINLLSNQLHTQASSACILCEEDINVITEC